MRTFPECYACLVRLATFAMSQANVEEQTQINVLPKVMRFIGDADPTISPSEIAGGIYKLIREDILIDDLFEETKTRSARIALDRYVDLKIIAKQGEDQFEQALKIAASGNIIDVVHSQDYNLWNEVMKMVAQPLLGSGARSLSEVLGKADHLLFLADNVGETVFDRVLIETLDLPVIYAVKGGAILNDATYKDAVDAGLDNITEVVETGSRSPGTILSECSAEFQQLFRESKVVLAKGQANYETLDQEGGKVFFLLRLKCPIISREIGYPIGSLVLEKGVE